MKALIDKLGGAFVTILVAGLLALITMIIKHDRELVLFEYRLDQIEKDFKEHDNHKVKK